MLCPKCGVAMTTRHIRSVEIDLCTEHGVWLDKGELAKIVLDKSDLDSVAPKRNAPATIVKKGRIGQSRSVAAAQNVGRYQRTLSASKRPGRDQGIFSGWWSLFRK